MHVDVIVAHVNAAVRRAKPNAPTHDKLSTLVTQVLGASTVPHLTVLIALIYMDRAGGYIHLRLRDNAPSEQFYEMVFLGSFLVATKVSSNFCRPLLILTFSGS